MADKPTVIKVSGKKTGKNNKFTIDEKRAPRAFCGAQSLFRGQPRHGRNKSPRRRARLIPGAQKVELDWRSVRLRVSASKDARSRGSCNRPPSASRAGSCEHAEPNR